MILLLPDLCYNEELHIGLHCDDTVKPVLNGHSKIDETKIFMTNGSSMKVKSIAQCSSWSILQYF